MVWGASRVVPLVVWLGLGPGCLGHEHGPPPQPAGTPRCDSPAQRLVDLTLPLGPGTARLPNAAPLQLTRVSDYGGAGARAHGMSLGDDVGTHVDAPARHAEGKRTLDELHADQLMLPAQVVDVSAKVKDNPDYRVGESDLSDWEASYGELRVGGLVIVNTGWHRRFNDPQKYLGRDAAGALHFPGLAPEAAKLMIERDVSAVGIDTASLDGGSGDACQRLLHGAGKLTVEGLANLDGLPPRKATVFIGVPPIVGGTAAPARVLALVPVEPVDEEAR